MDNHPIPQDVTGFQFKLIGNMTIKQFAYLATGIILALIFFQFPIMLFVKIPVSAFFALFGAGLAFLPISGRPMDMMIGNFIKALFRPTQFIYEKSSLARNNDPKPQFQPANTTQPFPSTPSTPPIPPTPAPLPATSPPPISIKKNEPAQFPAASPKPERNINLPNTPEYPNILTGMTKDPRGNNLPNILVEVTDKDGNPVRAFKTNEAGRFASATPLANGNYTIGFEDPKSQNKFTPITLIATGQVIAPIVAMSIDPREELRMSLFAAN